MIDELDKKIISLIQGDLPLDPRPFAVMAQEIGITEEEFVERVPLLKSLKPEVSIRKTVHNLFLENVMEQNPEAATIIQKYIESEEDIYSSSKDMGEEYVEPSEEDIDILRQHNIKYIIFDKKFLSDESLERMIRIVEKVLKDTPIYVDNDTIVYEIK